MDFTRVLEMEVFDNIVSVNASKHMFCVMVVCTKNKDEGVMDALLSVV